jgi:conjugative transfer signal peptidase TraF
MKRCALISWLVAAFLIAGVSALRSSGFVWATSPSVPRGLWRIRPVAPQRGSVVLVCPPDTEQFRAARVAGVVPPGHRCPGGYEPLLKYLAALPGDEIELGEQGMSVNGHRLVGPPATALDHGPAYLRSAPPQKVRVTFSDLWLYSTHSRSWDSRFFGPLPRAGLLGTATPILTEAFP